jgi:hypothetical protein
MANLRWSRRVQVSAAFLALSAAACTDAPPVAPETHDAVLPPPRAYTSWISGSSITLYDEDYGDAYTLNTETREIRRGSDGAILELTAEQAAAAATAFYGDAIADAVLNGFGSVCSPENPCAEPMGGKADGASSSFILTRESTNDRTHHGTTFGATIVGQPPLKPFKSSKKSFDLMAGGGICDDIVNAVFQHKLEYASQRTSFLRDGFIQAVLIGAGVAGRRALPAGTFGAARFMGQIAAAQDRKIAISVLGWMWNSYYCGAQPVTAGPIVRGAGGGSGAGYLSCHTETWAISFDGGNRWERISVEICDFVMQ